MLWYPCVFCFTGTTLSDVLNGVKPWVLEQEERFGEDLDWFKNKATQKCERGVDQSC